MNFAGWVAFGTLVIVFAWVTILFFLFRSDYHGHPDRTRIAVKLTISTVQHALRIKRGEPPPPPDRRAATHPRRQDDFGTISSPIKAIEPMKRRTPTRTETSDD